MSDLSPGRLLVASPALVDPNFYRSVVLLLEHDEDGAVGVVLDRPLDIGVDDHLPSWRSHLAPPHRVFEGGPVQPETAIGVAYRPAVSALETWRPVLGGVGLVDVSLDPADIDGIEEARIFAGYSGWGAGQLEMERAVGSWFPVEGSRDDVFDPVPTQLWRMVLRRQAPHIARYADYPEDLRSN
jgi:putative transcriptional regulator